MDPLIPQRGSFVQNEDILNENSTWSTETSSTSDEEDTVDACGSRFVDDQNKSNSKSHNDRMIRSKLSRLRIEKKRENFTRLESVSAKHRSSSNR